MVNGAHFYVIIEKSSNCCVQTIDTGTENWSVDDDYAYSMEVTVRGDYLDKYYIGGSWFEKIWNEYDEDGNPVESAGYILEVWKPETVV